MAKWNRFRGFILTQRNPNNDNNRISRAKAQGTAILSMLFLEDTTFRLGSQAATMAAALATDSDRLDWPTPLIFRSFRAIRATNPIPRWKATRLDTKMPVKNFLRKRPRLRAFRCTHDASPFSPRDEWLSMIPLEGCERHHCCVDPPSCSTLR